jgi:hypothetical protein
LQRKPLSNFGMKLVKSHDLWKTETEMELKKWRFSTSVCIKYWIVRLRVKKSKILHSNLSLELGRRVEGAISLTISCRRSLFRKFCRVICPWTRAPCRGGGLPYYFLQRRPAGGGEGGRRRRWSGLYIEI